MSTPVLVAESLTMRFGSFTAVDDVSFAVDPGQIVGLLGANGAGKTTVIRILLGMLAPTSGTSLLLGGPPDQERRARLGYVPQGLGLYPDLTVAENLAFVAGLYGATVPQLDKALLPAQDRLVGSIGLGLQRRLAFTCALLHSPAVLVLDEPTSGVGALARAQLWEVIHEQAANGVGVLVTTHYMQEAQQCDRMVLMSAGRLVASGSESDLVGNTRAVAVRVDDWAEAFAALDDAGLMVTLSGRNVRVAGAEPDRVASALAEHGIEAEVEIVPATIEERMTELAREARQ